jgi:hypothetical protein
MEITLKISDKVARKIYPGADPALKAILEDSCGGKPFFSQSIIERVNSLKDVFEIMGVDAFSFYSKNDTADERAYKEMKLVTKCLNEGWVPNWDNSNELKWYLWFWMDNPGFRLLDVYYSYTNSHVCSRLVFKAENLARHAFKIIPDSYRIFHTLNHQ